jgi:hypothetical protein
MLAWEVEPPCVVRPFFPLLVLLLAACGGGAGNVLPTPAKTTPQLSLPQGGGAPIAGCPTGIFVLATNTFDSVEDYTGALLHIYDEQSGGQISSLTLDSTPNAVVSDAVITTSGSTAYVFQNFSSGAAHGFTSTSPIPALTIVDTGTHAITHQIAFAGNLYWGILSNDQTKLYASGYDAQGYAFFTFSATDGSQLGRIPLPANSVLPYRVTLNPAGTAAYVMDINAKQIDRVDLVANTSSVFYNMDPSQSQQDVAMDAAGTKLYLTQYYNTLVLDPATAATIATIAPPPTSENTDMNESFNRSTMLLIGPPVISGGGDNEADVIPTTGTSITNMWNSGTFSDRTAINAAGTFGLLWLPQFQSVDITTWLLPSGSGEYYIATPNDEVVGGVAAQ